MYGDSDIGGGGGDDGVIGCIIGGCGYCYWYGRYWWCSCAVFDDRGSDGDCSSGGGGIGGGGDGGDVGDIM